MLKLKANPTFKAKVVIPAPGGEQHEIEIEFKHMTRSDVSKFIAEPNRSDVDTLLAIVAGWSGVDAEFSKEAAHQLSEQYVAAPRAIVQAWLDELTVARTKN